MSKPIPSLTRLAWNATSKSIEHKIATSKAELTLQEWQHFTTFLVNQGLTDPRSIKNYEEPIISTTTKVNANTHLQTQITTCFLKLQQAFPIPLSDLPKVQTWENKALRKIKDSQPSVSGIKGSSPDFVEMPSGAALGEFLIRHETNFELNNDQECFNNITFIFLENAKIKAIPSELQQCQSLTSLQLSNNCITFIPGWIGNLKNLESLALQRNQIKAIPDSIGQLKKLRSLILVSNQIRRLPDAMESLSLKILLVSNNQIEEIPNWIDKIRFSKTESCYFAFDHNPIRSFPKNFKDLDFVHTVSIHHNQININWLSAWSQLALLRVVRFLYEIDLNYARNPDIDLTCYNISNTI
jgi:hypothetical protein